MLRDINLDGYETVRGISRAMIISYAHWLKYLLHDSVTSQTITEFDVFHTCAAILMVLLVGLLQSPFSRSTGGR